MATTRAEADALFSYALPYVRAAGVAADGQSRADDAEVARLVWQRFRGTGDIVYGDALAATKRAVRAREGGAALTTDPNNPGAWLAKAYAEKPVIDRRRGRYEYRVVVRAEGQGARFETMLVVYSRDRLSGADVMSRAQRTFQQSTAAQPQYRTRVASVGQEPTFNFWIVSATRDTG